MQKKKIYLVFIMAAGLLLNTLGHSVCAQGSTEKKFRILYIMSYHSPWEWTDDLLKGFKDALKGMDVEYSIFQMDTKRKSSQEWKEQAGKEARDLIDSSRPDLVYTSDDNAQLYVAKYYLDKDVPFVFSAVNADPAVYGFTGSRNITGVLEHEHSIETIKLLKEIAPAVTKIGLVFDDDPTWSPVIERIRQRVKAEIPGIELVILGPIYTFEEYKQKINEAQGTLDALGLLGVHTFKDTNNQNIPWQDVLKWTAENSNLPDFSFWKDRVPYGTLCVVYVSGYEQGLAAGEIAKGILAQAKSPSIYPMKPTLKGKPIISLARARKLGLKIKSGILLTAEVVEKFEWDK